MTWLLWKEYRLQRLILAVGIFLLVFPHAVRYFANAAPEAIGYAAFVSTILSILTLALLGGNAIASERADRSAEFQAYQPISRGMILATKLLIPVLAACVLWGVNLYVFDHWSPIPYAELRGSREWMLLFFIFGFAAFSVAWLLSAIQSSPTFAIGAGMAAPVATMMLLALLAWLASGLGFEPSGQSFNNTWSTVNLTLGLLSFTGGTAYYLLRVEP